jgi:hypothetical protein
MAKARVERTSDGMRKEYDLSGGVRGKYYERFAKYTDTLVLLDADVAEVFPNSRSVNTALRAIIPIVRLRKPRRRKAG